MDFLIHHMLRASAERQPDKQALVHDGRSLSYTELAESVRSIACGLRSAGVSKHDRVGVLAKASIEQCQSIFGVSQAGGVFVPIHHSLYPKQVAHIVRDCEMTTLVVDGARLADLVPAMADCTSLEQIVVIGETNVDVPWPCYRLDDWSRQESSDVDDTVIEKDLAAILYTSGSTGKPKGVMLSHANVIAGASIVSSYLGITEADRTLAILPFSFDAGLNQLMTGIQQTATVVLKNWLFAKEIVRTLEQEQITGLAGVPSLWNLLAQPSSSLASTPLPHLRYITNTGGALAETAVKQLRDAIPSTDVVLMYGLTEAFRSTYLPMAELDRRGCSMGRAIPNTEILVVNEQGERCGAGEVGELVHHGPTVSLGYWGRPDLTEQVLRPHPFPPPGVSEVPKVVYSGDLVKMDEDGYLYFIGRRDNQIKCSGFRISPTEVEQVLYQSGCLKDAAVIGVPDDMLGQRIKAFVTPRDGTEVDVGELLSFCSSEMPRHMVPKSIEVLAELPKTSSGKIDYPSLRHSEVVQA